MEKTLNQATETRKSMAFSLVSAVTGVLVLLILIPESSFSQTAKTEFDIVHVYHRDAMQKIKAQYQYTGSITVNGEEPQEQPNAFPLDIRTSINYDQRVTNASAEAAQAVRLFNKSEADIKAGRGATATRLSGNNRLILARIRTTETDLTEYHFASVADTLTQREYELLKNPADPLTWHRLFTKTGVKIGDTWEVAGNVAASFLALDRVISSDLSLKLQRVNGDEARIFITGKVKGEIDDVIANMKIKGLATLNVKQQQVTALRMDIEKDRRIGQVAPGFEGQVKIALTMAGIEDNPRISKQALTQAYRGKKVRFTFKVDQEESDYSIICDPHWRVIASEKEGAILRYIDDGQVVAECNVAQLPNRPADRPLQLDEFKQEVGKIISRSKATIIDSSQFRTATGLVALQLRVSGVESEVPVSWIYYHVNGDDGRRLTLVFTLEQDVMDDFGSADRALVDQVQLKPQRATQAEKSGTTKNR